MTCYISNFSYLGAYGGCGRVCALGTNCASSPQVVIAEFSKSKHRANDKLATVSRAVRTACSVLAVVLGIMVGACGPAEGDDETWSEDAPTGVAGKADGPGGDPAGCPSEWPTLWGTRAEPIDNSMRAWDEMIDRLHQEEDCYEDPSDPACSWLDDWSRSALEAWRDEIDEMGAIQDRLSQLAAVERFVNGWPYRTDMAAYGQEDHYATPLELMRHAGGDCEDFAIMKYVTLERLGWCKQHLRGGVVYDKVGAEMHFVLTALFDGTIHVLDNQQARLHSASDVVRYHPLLSVNRLGKWAQLTPP